MKIIVESPRKVGFFGVEVSRKIPNTSLNPKPRARQTMPVPGFSSPSGVPD